MLICGRSRKAASIPDWGHDGGIVSFVGYCQFGCGSEFLKARIVTSVEFSDGIKFVLTFNYGSDRAQYSQRFNYLAVTPACFSPDANAAERERFSFRMRSTS